MSSGEPSENNQPPVMSPRKDVDHAEGIKEDELIKELWRMDKKKKSERSPAEIAVLVDKLIAVLEFPSDASDRLRKLQLLSFALSERQLEQAILDHRVLSLLKVWLEPTHDDISNDIDVQNAVLQILRQSPIDLREQLKNSGIDKVVVFFPNSEDETDPTRILVGDLVDKWYADDEYGGPNVKKLKSREEEETDGENKDVEETSSEELENKYAEEISSEELMKLGMTEDEFYNDGKRTMTKDEQKLYFDAIRESGGFDVPDFPDVFNMGFIQPLDKLDAYIEELTMCINVAIQEKCPDLKLVKILKANDQALQRYFITFEAQEPDDKIKTYQTKVYVGLPSEKIEVEEFRLKPSV